MSPSEFKPVARSIIYKHSVDRELDVGSRPVFRSRFTKLNVGIRKQEENKMSVLDCEFRVPFRLSFTVLLDVFL